MMERATFWLHGMDRPPAQACVRGQGGKRASQFSFDRVTGSQAPLSQKTNP